MVGVIFRVIHLIAILLSKFFFLKHTTFLYIKLTHKMWVGKLSAQIYSLLRKRPMFVSRKSTERPQSLMSSRDELPWSSCDSSGYGTDNSGRPTRIIVPKANSFGGTQTFVLQNLKASMRGGSLSKAGDALFNVLVFL